MVLVVLIVVAVHMGLVGVDNSLLTRLITMRSKPDYVEAVFCSSSSSSSLSDTH